MRYYQITDGSSLAYRLNLLFRKKLPYVGISVLKERYLYLKRATFLPQIDDIFSLQGLYLYLKKVTS